MVYFSSKIGNHISIFHAFLIYLLDKLLQSDQNEKEKAPKGQQYRFVEDFGEQMTSKHQTVIVVFDLETNELKVLPRKKNTASRGMYT